jgi:hypothetical protein
MGGMPIFAGCQHFIERFGGVTASRGEPSCETMA